VCFTHRLTVHDPVVAGAALYVGALPGRLAGLELSAVSATGPEVPYSILLAHDGGVAVVMVAVE
jgi:hypothetical protein